MRNYADKDIERTYDVGNADGYPRARPFQET